MGRPIPTDGRACPPVPLPETSWSVLRASGRGTTGSARGVGGAGLGVGGCVGRRATVTIGGPPVSDSTTALAGSWGTGAPRMDSVREFGVDSVVSGPAVTVVVGRSGSTAPVRSFDRAPTGSGVGVGGSARVTGAGVAGAGSCGGRRDGTTGSRLVTGWVRAGAVGSDDARRATTRTRRGGVVGFRGAVARSARAVGSQWDGAEPVETVCWVGAGTADDAFRRCVAGCVAGPATESVAGSEVDGPAGGSGPSSSIRRWTKGGCSPPMSPPGAPGSFGWGRAALRCRRSTVCITPTGAAGSTA